jgi:hypothetical protein
VSYLFCCSICSRRRLRCAQKRTKRAEEINEACVSFSSCDLLSLSAAAGAESKAERFNLVDSLHNLLCSRAAKSSVCDGKWTKVSLLLRRATACKTIHSNKSHACSIFYLWLVLRPHSSPSCVFFSRL